MKAGFVGSILRVASVAAIPLAALTISAPANAQRSTQRELFEWRGNVDQEIRVQMQGGRASVMAMGPREMTGYNNARAMSALPSANGYVTVQMREGRGSADVIEQPTAQNGYTTVVRIRDNQGGAGAYDVAAFWQPNGNYGQYGNYGQNGQYGNYGRYNTYPQTVIVQQPVYQPVYRQPVYGDRGVQGGKALPAPQRSNTYPTQQRYPDRVTPNGGYQSGHVQSGKTLPTASSESSQSRHAGKTLPGADQSSQQNHGWPRGH